jgi:hypothetical protein
VATVASLFPAASVAETEKRCLPGLTFLVNGDVQPNVLQSIKQVKLDAASVEVNANLAMRLVVFFFGRLVISVSGAVVSPLPPPLPPPPGPGLGLGLGPGPGPPIVQQAVPPGCWVICRLMSPRAGKNDWRSPSTEM